MSTAAPVRKSQGRAMSDPDNPFARWSRRKRRVVEEEAQAVPAPETAVEEVPEPKSDDEESELLERLGLPAPETLGEGDDFSAFMKAGVPEFLRKRALRVLWRSNPVLANLDGLNDYDDDFNSPELTKKVLATAYQVGRGILRNPEDTQAEDGSDAHDEEEEVDDGYAVELADVGSNDPKCLPKVNVDPPREPEIDAEENEPTPRPRRMRFETGS